MSLFSISKQKPLCWSNSLFFCFRFGVSLVNTSMNSKKCAWQLASSKCVHNTKLNENKNTNKRKCVTKIIILSFKLTPFQVVFIRNKFSKYFGFTRSFDKFLSIYNVLKIIGKYKTNLSLQSAQ